MITDRLKQETFSLHQQLEKWVVHRIRSMQTLEHYTHLLQLFLGFYQPLENRMLPFVQTVLPDLGERRKSMLIQHDIDALQAGNNDIRLCCHLPVITSTAGALGAMYVFEGSTLGGAIIAKMVKGKIAGLPGTALQFFQGYGAHTQEKWEGFKQYMNEHITGEKQHTAVIDGANDTFYFFYEWLKNN